MKAIIVTRQGHDVSNNVEFVADFPDPRPAAGQLLVRTEASSLNQLDLWVGRGVPGFEMDYPRIGGSDGVGTVVEVGDGVDESWLDQRVMINAAVFQDPTPRPGRRAAGEDIIMIGEHVNGTHAEFFVVPATNALVVSQVDPINAAAYGLTHLTAWRMMVTRARIQPGSDVLIPGIGGGVALAALGIAQHLACRTIVTSRHQHKLDAALSLGASEGVLDEGQDFSGQVRSLTGKRGVDVCVDSVGKVVHESCLKSLARGGTFVTCGCTSGRDPATDLARIFWNQLSILGSTMGDMDEFQAASSLLKSGAIEPVIDSTWNPVEGRNAYERLESSKQFGKIVFDWR